MGTRANAVKTQVWTALIAILLVKYLQRMAKFKWSLSNQWLNDPFQARPVLAGVHEAQLELGLEW